MITLDDKTVLVAGFARTGQAVARQAARHGAAVTAIDDRSSEAGTAAAARLGVALHIAPTDNALRSMCEEADLIVLSPGVPPSHRMFMFADLTKVISEIELAFRMTTTPIIAITGTNGKTTVTSLVAAMLAASGLKTRAVGNIGTPLIDVIDEPLDVVVVEVSSFQLAYTELFRPAVGTWLNFSEDHLDWHPDLADYAASKARLWRAQNADDVAVANCEDEVVWGAAQSVAAPVVSFGMTSGDYHLDGDVLVGPEGVTCAHKSDLRRTYPHDIVNALAAIATARAGGATLQGCVEALHHSEDLPHRVQYVDTIDGVQYINDSKATTPSAVVAALQGFSSVVLIAGGRNKGLDLGGIGAAFADGAGPAVHGIIAIGEATDEIEIKFGGRFTVQRASSMSEAVDRATELAVIGDAVLLSPGCASFDWYQSYGERGDDFVRCVRALAESRVSAE